MEKNDRTPVSQVQLLQFSIHKIAQIILQSRCIFPQEEIANASFDKRFNLQIPDYVSIRNEITTHLAVSLYGTLQFDIFIATRDGDVLLERWMLHYEHLLPPHATNELDASTLYLRLIVLCRTLYTHTRLLPVYAVHRSCVAMAAAAVSSSPSSPQSGSQSMFYVLTANQQASDTASLWDSSPASYCYAPLHTGPGKLHLAVTYRKNCDAFLQCLPAISAPFNQHSIITDYIASSPATADSNPPLFGTTPIAIARQSFSAATATARLSLSPSRCPSVEIGTTAVNSLLPKLVPQVNPFLSPSQPLVIQNSRIVSPGTSFNEAGSSLLQQQSRFLGGDGVNGESSLHSTASFGQSMVGTASAAIAIASHANHQTYPSTGVLTPLRALALQHNNAIGATNTGSALNSARNSRPGSPIPGSGDVNAATTTMPRPVYPIGVVSSYPNQSYQHTSISPTLAIAMAGGPVKPSALTLGLPAKKRVVTGFTPTATPSSGSILQSYNNNTNFTYVSAGDDALYSPGLTTSGVPGEVPVYDSSAGHTQMHIQSPPISMLTGSLQQQTTHRSSLSSSIREHRAWQQPQMIDASPAKPLSSEPSSMPIQIHTKHSMQVLPAHPGIAPFSGAQLSYPLQVGLGHFGLAGHGLGSTNNCELFGVAANTIDNKGSVNMKRPVYAAPSGGGFIDSPQASTTVSPSVSPHLQGRITDVGVSLTAPIRRRTRSHTNLNAVGVTCAEDAVGGPLGYGDTTPTTTISTLPPSGVKPNGITPTVLSTVPQSSVCRSSTASGSTVTEIVAGNAMSVCVGSNVDASVNVGMQSTRPLAHTSSNPRSIPVAVGRMHSNSAGSSQTHSLAHSHRSTPDALVDAIYGSLPMALTTRQQHATDAPLPPHHIGTPHTQFLQQHLQSFQPPQLSHQQTYLRTPPQPLAAQAQMTPPLVVPFRSVVVTSVGNVVPAAPLCLTPLRTTLSSSPPIYIQPSPPVFAGSEPNSAFASPMIATPFPVLSLVPPIPLPVVSSGSFSAAAIGTAGIDGVSMFYVASVAASTTSQFYSPPRHLGFGTTTVAPTSNSVLPTHRVIAPFSAVPCITTPSCQNTTLVNSVPVPRGSSGAFGGSGHSSRRNSISAVPLLNNPAMISAGPDFDSEVAIGALVAMCRRAEPLHSNSNTLARQTRLHRGMLDSPAEVAGCIALATSVPKVLLELERLKTLSDRLIPSRIVK